MMAGDKCWGGICQSARFLKILLKLVEPHLYPSKRTPSVSQSRHSIEVNASGVLVLREGGIVREHFTADTTYLQLGQANVISY